MNETITAVIRATISRQENWAALAAVDEHDQDISVTVTGIPADFEFPARTTFQFSGRHHHHEKFGPQFKATSFCQATPISESQVRLYLKRWSGIGHQTAASMVSVFGVQVLDMIADDPHEAADNIHRLTLDTAIDIAEDVRRCGEMMRVELAVAELLGGRGFSGEFKKRVIAAFKLQAVERIRRDPYCLLKFAGCGFRRADAIYLDLGGDPARMKRQILCLADAMERDRGNTWISRQQAERILKEKIAGTRLRPLKAIRIGRRAGLFSTRTDGGQWLALNARGQDERNVARLAAIAINESGGWPWSDYAFRDCTDHQRDQIRIAQSGNLTALIGAPGVGKTFSAGRIIKSVEDLAGIGSVAVASPTAKAAVRVNEFLESIAATARATTIHKLLMARKHGDGWRWNFNEANPLPNPFLIVDESSMISTDLMAALLAARPPGGRVMLVGDCHQLQPVGHGKPLWDLLPRILVGELTEFHRNAGVIVKACHQIRSGVTNFDTVDRLDIDARHNLKHVTTRDDAASINAIVDILKDVQRGKRFDALEDGVVLCATNAARHTLNAKLQEQFNPNGATVTGSKFKVGDPIICRRNQWRRDLNKNADVFVENGAIGIAQDVAANKVIVQFKNPLRRVLVPIGKRGDDDDPGCKFDLAYAITGHSSQGSQWPVVIVMLEDSFNARRVAGRSWLYTAISRASSACVLVGKRTTASQMIQRVGVEARKTFVNEEVTRCLGN